VAQDVEKKKAEPGTPHLLILNQDIVYLTQEDTRGLKYLIHSPAVSLSFRWSRFYRVLGSCKYIEHML